MTAISTTMSERVGRALSDALAAEPSCTWDADELARIAAGDITVGEWFVLAESLGRPPHSFL